MKLRGLKKWVYFYDKWFTYGIIPLGGMFLLVLTWLLEKNYILLVRSDFLLISIFICSFSLILLISLFYRMYLHVRLGKEFWDPYLLSLDKKKRLFYYVYILSWLAAMTVFTILIIQANPDYKESFVKFMVIPPVGLFISLLVYVLYLQKKEKNMILISGFRQNH